MISIDLYYSNILPYIFKYPNYIYDYLKKNIGKQF